MTCTSIDVEVCCARNARSGLFATELNDGFRSCPETRPSVTISYGTRSLTLSVLPPTLWACVGCQHGGGVLDVLDEGRAFLQVRRARDDHRRVRCVLVLVEFGIMLQMLQQLLTFRLHNRPRKRQLFLGLPVYSRLSTLRPLDEHSRNIVRPTTPADLFTNIVQNPPLGDDVQ